MKNSTVTGTTRSLRITGATHYAPQGGNTTGNGFAACRAPASRARAERHVHGNGGGTGGDPIAGYGGIAVVRMPLWMPAVDRKPSRRGPVVSGNNTLRSNRPSTDALDFTT
jgi:hypothetical protein